MSSDLSPAAQAFHLAGKPVIVTGSTRGLGLAFAKDLARHGARLILNGRDPDAGRHAEAEVATAGGEAVFVPGSVAEARVADELVDRCFAAFGAPPHMLVNNAGVIRDRSLLKMSEQDFDDVVEAHLRGSWLASRAAARAMVSEGGVILNVVSGSALFGLFGQSSYAAAKGGMIALTRSLSLELHRFGVRVNALYPAALTDMTRSVVEAAGAQAARLPDFRPPEDVAPVVTYLASSAARDLTGQVLSFDGRTLAVWTHPAPAHAASRSSNWAPEDMRRAFEEGDLRSEPLHPDAIGMAVRHALASAR